MVEKVYISYNHVHKLCQEAAEVIKEFNPHLMIAIGGGGFIPARILRTFLKKENAKNIPIQAIGLSLYEDLGTDTVVETAGLEVVRTQWLDFGAMAEHSVDLIGKNVLIVDEVDDTRTTLHYALSELEKDVQEQAEKLGRTDEVTKFFIFVLHNKDKPKRAQLPKEMLDSGRYLAARTVPDYWIAYPWEAKDIVEHSAQAIKQGND
ncbi:xanthine phosphoribosyltransferase [Sugiyamaella lignohabitans]|uniref:Xanthine phosphoribosyltransferase n=1 Tax=Sugiyamaella lignohabitans TaxID=796027 RepID=A0A167DGT2_9ASCO|nr:xanthine phosphoribosyltransferase [Sugiyamaella lignohabitans]ANB12902.1 xanthine phosphoribosyltransferase [Sugiyamaella lignohabitans]